MIAMLMLMYPMQALLSVLCKADAAGLRNHEVMGSSTLHLFDISFDAFLEVPCNTWIPACSYDGHVQHANLQGASPLITCRLSLTFTFRVLSVS